MSPESRHVGPKSPVRYLLVVFDAQGRPLKAQSGFLVKDEPHPTTRFRDVRGKTMEELGDLPNYKFQRLPRWKP